MIDRLRSVEGREEGYRILMAKYQQRIYWYVRRYVLHHEDANDVLQNTFMKIFTGIGSYTGRARLSTWIYRIATNEALTFMKKKKSKMITPLEDISNNQQITSLKSDPYFDGDTTQLKLLQALELLPDKQRTIFNLRYYEELPYKDISEILGTSVGALKASYHHAVKKIERHFKMMTL